MSSTIWKKIRRVFAIVLIVALFGNNVPQTLFRVQAEVNDENGGDLEDNPTESSLVNIAEDSGFAINFVQDIADGVQYTGTAIRPEVSVTYQGTPLVEGTHYILDYVNNTAVSTEKIKAEVIVIGTAEADATEGYYGRKSRSFTIVDNRDVLTEANVTYKAALGTVGSYPVYAYTGDEIKIVESVIYDGKELIEGTDYTVTYENNSEATDNAGATVTISGKGNYKTEVNIVKNFGIRKVLKSENVMIDVADGHVYNGNAQTPGVTVTFTDVDDNEVPLIKDSDYEVVYEHNVNAGTSAKVTVTGKGSYYGTVDTSFSINQADISGLNLEIADILYTGEEFVPNELVVNLLGVDSKIQFSRENYSGITCKNTEDTIKEVGQYIVVITGTGNYTGTKEITFAVKPATAIPEDAVELSGNFAAAAENDTYYYNNASDVVFEAVKIGEVTYTITGCIGGVLDQETGCVTLSEGSNTLTLTVIGKKGNVECYNGTLTYNFVQDNSAPKLEVIGIYTNHYTNDGKNWAQGIGTPSVTCEDGEEESGNAKVYYTTTEVDEDALDEVVLSDCTEWTNSVALAGNTTYYFIAVDNVDNRTMVSITTPVVDTTAPAIVVKDGNDDIDTRVPVYLNAEDLTGGKKVFDVQASDENGSGVKADFEANTDFTPADSMATDKAIISNSAIDNVENGPTEHSFTVVYDAIKPKFEVATVEGIVADEKTKITNGDDEIAILTKQNVKITVQVAEDVIDGEYQLDKIEIWENETVMREISADSMTNIPTDTESGKAVKEYSFTVEVEDGGYLKDTYKVVAYDKADNNTTSKIFNVEIDKKKPVIQSVKLDGDDSIDGWVNTETEFVVTVVDSNNSSAEISLMWKKASSSDNPVAVSGSDWAEIPADNVTKEVTDGVATYTFTYKETDENFEGTYSFKAFDSLGHESDEKTRNLKKDAMAPDVENVYVEYKADAVDEADNAAKKSFFEKVYEFFFAKNKIDVVVYVRDDISGIASVTYEYAGEGDEVAAELNDSAVIDGKNYSIVKIILTADANTNVKDNLHIIAVTDNAGNSVTVPTDTITELNSGDVLIIDNVAPQLEVALDDDCEEINSYYAFVQQEDESAEEIKLTYKEAYYKYNLRPAVEGEEQRETVKPDIEIVTVDAEGNQTPVANVKTLISWDETKEEELVGTISLPYDEDGAEIQYIIRSTYADGSGNQLAVDDLECGAVNVSNGNTMYESGIIVLDNKAPELKGCDVETTVAGTYKEAADEDALSVYQSNAVDVKVTIEDNATYWNQDNAELVIYKNGEVHTTVAANNLTWTPMGDAHTTTYTFTDEDGDGQSATYYATLSYVDFVGNKMISNLDEGTCEDGKYTGKAFVLDEQAPKFNISYNAADVLVANGDTVADKENAVPITGYTAYYEEQIDVTISIEERYAQQIWNTNNKLDGLEDIAVNIYAADANGNAITDGTDYAQAENFAIEWSKKDGAYEGKFSLVEAGSYVIMVSYRDRATNAMVAGTVQGSKSENAVENGVYTSTKLVIDGEDAAPTVSVKYVTKENENAEAVEVDPVNTVNGCKYFNDDNLYMVITVEDANARYKELKDVLVDMGAYNSSNAPVDTAAKAMINALNEATVAEGGFVVEIPLTTEAEYTIPVKYKDILGHEAELDVTEYVTVDRTAPETDSIKVNYLSDTGEKNVVERFVNALIDWIYGLFGNERIDVTLEIYDEVSGVAKVRYTYAGKTEEITEITPVTDQEDRVNGFYRVEFPLTVEKGSFSEDELKLALIEDNANNKVENISDGKLVLDSVNPTLAVAFDKAEDKYTIFEDKTYFKYETDAKEEIVKLTFTEKNYLAKRDADGNVSEPVIEIVTVDANGNETAVEGANSMISWGDGYDVDTEQITATISLPYEKEDGGAEIEYRIKASYVDRSRNPLKAGTIDDYGTLNEETGNYVSGSIVLDNQAPVFGITYNAADRLVLDSDVNSAKDQTSVSPETGYTAYYQKQDASTIEVTLTIDEDCAMPQMQDGKIIEMGGFELEVHQTVISENEAGKQMEQVTDIADTINVDWTKEANSNQYKGTFSLNAEGSYEVKISYKDIANNEMIAGSTVIGSKDSNAAVANGSYNSTNLVIDGTAPEISVQYITKESENADATEVSPINTKEGRKYFNCDKLYLRVTVEDVNARVEELKAALDKALSEDELKILNSRSESVTDSEFVRYLNSLTAVETAVLDGDGFYFDIPLTTEAEYTIPLSFTDLAGNKTVTDTELVTVDRTTPVGEDGENGKGIVVSYSAEDTDEKKEGVSFFDKITDWFYGLFGKEKIAVTLQVYDETAGIEAFGYDYVVVDSEGEVEESLSEFVTIDDKNSIKKLTDGNGNPTGWYEHTIELLIKEDTKFVEANLLVNVTDLAKNTLKNATGGTVLALDKDAPVLDVALPENLKNTVDGKKFYAQEGDEEFETVILTFTEENYGKYRLSEDAPVEPKIEIWVDGNQLTDSEKLKEIVKISWPEEEGLEAGKATATINLPYADKEKRAEIEYVIKSNYADRSTNQMVAGELACGAVETVGEENWYQSAVIVLDNKAPEVTEYAINMEPSDVEEAYIGDASYEVNVYQTNEVTINFTVADNAKYWNKDNVTVELFKDGRVVEGNSNIVTSLSWDASQTAEHTATYTITDNTNNGNVASTYSIQVTYADYAGNLLVEKTETTPEYDKDNGEGTYISEDFVMDKIQPVFKIEYSEPERVVWDSGEAVGQDELNIDNVHTSTDAYTAYYGEGGITVTIILNEDYGQMSSDQLEDVVLKVKYGATAAEFVAESEVRSDLVVTWSEQPENQYVGTFRLVDEGYYSVELSYKDKASNTMMAGDKVEYGLVDDDTGVYKSNRMVIDTTAPAIKATLIENSTAMTDADWNKVNEDDRRLYIHKDVTGVSLLIEVADNNIRHNEMLSVLQNILASEIDGTVVGSDAKNQIDSWIRDSRWVVDQSGAVKWSIPLTTEANYSIPICFTDLAGNTTYQYQDAEGKKVNNAEGAQPQLVVIDYHSPVSTEATGVNEVSDMVNTKDNVHTNINIDYKVEAVQFYDFIKYADLGYLFADSKLTITATTKDEIAGVRSIYFEMDEDLEKEGIDLAKRSDEMAPSADAQRYSVTIPLDENATNFKGNISAKAVDWCDNETGRTHGYIVDCEDEAGSVVINNRTAPSRTVDGVSYYNSDVNLSINFRDEFAGINNLEISSDFDKVTANFETNEYAVGITGAETREFSLSTAKYNYNDVVVKATFTDNTNRTYSTTQTYNIDATKPVITVTYDLNTPANELYYNAARTATVEIQERNFSERDVEFTITNTDGVMPAISGWTSSGSGDNTVHRCNVIFAEDGDYTFTVAFRDLAGNVAEYDRVDTFTIDRTVPTYTVTYDNNDSKNGFYYAAGRTATIDILEHNFDASLINIAMTATNGSGGVPTVSGWTRNGDHNIATIHFATDADYTFDISGMDMSENPLEDYAGDHFVVDTIQPTLEITGVEHMSANKGTVMPVIIYEDTNYDPDSSVIEMIGANNGKVEILGDVTTSSTGVEIHMHDFEHIAELDDLYTMNVTVFDLAGNEISDSITFSVNRFGSVYTFDTTTDSLVGTDGKYYTNEEQDIVITETNVDSLEFLEITCNLNGSLFTLVEGEHYELIEEGSDASWKQYTYKILKKNFTEEGTYILTIYSKDRATNTSDNSSKGKKIEFVVDKTNPSVLISGIVNGEQYRENSREVTLDVQDNVLLSEVKVILNGLETVYNAAQLDDMDGKIVFTIDSANNWQTLSIVASDAAGNTITSEEMQFLITTNIFIQLVMNTPLLIGVSAAVVALGAGGFYLIGYKRRKKSEK